MEYCEDLAGLETMGLIRVLNAYTGVPISNAKIVLTSGTFVYPTIYTNESGVVTIDYLGDNIKFEVTKEGFESHIGYYSTASTVTINLVPLDLVKAVEFGTFWAENTPGQLKTIAQAAISSMPGAGLTDDPIQFTNGLAYVVFTVPSASFTELNAVSSIRSAISALLAWTKANPGTAIKISVFLTASAFLTAISIKIVDWATKNIEYQLEVDTTKQAEIDKVLDDLHEGKITAEEAAGLIDQILTVGSTEGLDWMTTVLYIGAGLAVAYVVSSMMKRRNN